MLCPDLPITKSDDDVLNRGSFAESLAKTIVQYSSPSSLTIGLYGRWGSGKTSLLNMIFENVEKIDDSVAIIRFDPWLCSDPRQLVTQFFKQMATAIKVKKPKAEKVWELIDQYADVFDLTSFLNVRGIAVAPFFRILAKIAKKQAEQRSKDVQKSKEQIAARLSKEKLKIVVSIDDIDRLSEEEIIAVFQLVKSLADFPNMIYVLAFDYDVVIRALGEVQHGDGKEYLEKIIQVPFEIPAPSMTDIHEALFSKLNAILGNMPEEQWEKEIWAELFQYGIKKYIKSIRDVIRYTNVFSLKYELLKDETNPADLLGLTCLQVFEPTIYSKLHNYKDVLCGENEGYSYENKTGIEKNVEKIVSLIVPDDGSIANAEAANNLLGILFPRIKKYVGLSYNAGRAYSHRSFCIKNNIAAHECFSRYFALTLENDAISTTKVRHMIYEADADEFNIELMQIYNEGKIVRLLEAIELYSNDRNRQNISEERAIIIINILSRNWNLFKVDDTGILNIPFAWRLLFCVDPLLKAISIEARAPFILALFEDKGVALSTLALLLQDFERQLGRFTENTTEKEDAVLPLECVLELEATFRKRAVEEIDSGATLKQGHGLKFLWMFEQIDPETASNKEKRIITDDASLAKVIDYCTSRGTVETKIAVKTRTVDYDNLGKFIDVDKAYQRVKILADTNQFLLLTEDEQMSVMAFILVMERKSTDSNLWNCIAEDTIKKALDRIRDTKD